ncbi:hypothetical protein M408DRAFT_28109 [Serendipita vermifera MAFF 305830]|uniref:Uncharacterized protein n=1 Tax=Serendipita vermifera MAFF 305830 TaxID=933852 RepID=A0A0C3AT59_SERVB|nr:hypothetical protein M408DRAFT_28109 [Serendipita vermifera MAFF 305830]
MVSALPILVVFGAMALKPATSKSEVPPLGPGVLSTASPKITEELFKTLTSLTAVAPLEVAFMTAAESLGLAHQAVVLSLIASALASAPAKDLNFSP